MDRCPSHGDLDGDPVYLVANDGWYGVGWGDFGIEFEMTVALLTVLAAMAGVVMHKCAVGLCLGIRRARTG